MKIPHNQQLFNHFQNRSSGLLAPLKKTNQTNKERDNQTIHNLLKWKGQFNQNMTAENYVATNTSLKMLLMTIN